MLSHLYRAFLTALVLASASLHAGAVQASYYVDAVRGDDLRSGLSPDEAFRTITRARDAVRRINQRMTGDINIYLRGGVYEIAAPVKFEPCDSGSEGFYVRYQAYKKEEPILQSTRRVTGWVLHDPVRNIYKVAVGDTDAFRQLYVNGNPAIRARQPNLSNADKSQSYFKILNGFYDNARGTTRPPFDVAVGEVGDFTNDPRTEIHWNAKWGFFIVHAAGYTVKGDIATVAINPDEAKYRNIAHRPSKHPVYYWENNLGFLDAPGEWYWDGSTNGVKGSGWLYYKPRDGESMTTAVVLIPQAETLIDVSGTGVNVALGKPVTASGYAPGFAPARVVDGDFNKTYWRSSGSVEKWIAVDLGRAHTISRFVVNHYENVAPRAAMANTKAFKVQIGDDGVTWTDHETIDDNTINNSSVKKNFTARYVRLLITEPTAHSYTADSDARIAELSLYETTEVHHLAFSGLTFRYSGWNAPSARGYSTNQAGLNVETGPNHRYTENMGPPPGMFQAAYSNHLVIERNKFYNGGAIAIRSLFDSTETRIVGNRIERFAGGGIAVGVGTSIFDGRIWACSQSDVIENNFVADCGLSYKDAPGIVVTLAKNLRLRHNEVARLPWVGISVGWHWTGTSHYGNRDNDIGFNQVHGVMRILHDGGGIYLPGRQDNTVVHQNYIYDIPALKNYGIYLDNGASYERVESNVINNARYAFQSNVPTHDNVFEGNFHNQVKFDTDDNIDPKSGYKPNRVINSTLVAGQGWPEPAKAIMRNAGIQPEFTDIISDDNNRDIGDVVESDYIDCTGYTLVPNEYLTPPSRNCWAVLKPDGNFIVYKGSPGAIDQGVLWQTGSVGVNDGRYYARPTDDGIFNIYRGTFRAQKPAVVHYQLRFAGGKSVYGYHLKIGDDQRIHFCEDLSPEFERGTLWSSPVEKFQVINKGHRGDNSADGLKRFARDVVALNPTTTVIFFGMNDAVNEAKSIPLKDYAANLGKMVRSAKAVGSSCILVSVNPVIEEALYRRHDPEIYTAQGGANAIIDRYADAALQVAREEGVPSVDFNAQMKQEEYDLRKPKSVIRSDGVHPTDRGADLLASAIAHAIARNGLDPTRTICIGDSITWMGYPDRLAFRLNFTGE